MHLLQVADALQKRLGEPRPPRVGARGVPRAGGRLRRARRRHRLRPPPAHQRAGRQVRAVARELVAWREETARERGPPRLHRAQRRGARRDRPAQARRPQGALADPRRERGDAAPPRRRAPRRGRPRPRAAADPARWAAPARRPTPQDAPLIALGEALVRTRAMEARLAYELSRRARTSSASSARSATASPSPRRAPCRAGAASSSGRSCWSSSPAAGACGSARTERSTSRRSRRGPAVGVTEAAAPGSGTPRAHAGWLPGWPEARHDLLREEGHVLHRPSSWACADLHRRAARARPPRTPRRRCSAARRPCRASRR